MGTVRDKAISFLVVIIAAVVLLASLAASTAVTALTATAQHAVPAAWLWGPLEFVASGAILTAVFAGMFRMLPRVRIAWRDVAAGAALTAFLFSVVKKLFAYYLAHIGSYAAYGAAGAVLGLLFWIYVTSLIVYFGAEFSRLYAERFGSLAKVHDASPERAPPALAVRKDGPDVGPQRAPADSPSHSHLPT